jgi:DeoR/GlpR family transcriptional regulator of sugar metabolism
MLVSIRDALKETLGITIQKNTKGQSRWEIIRTRLNEREYITNADVRELMDVSPATANRILSGLCEEKKLIKIRKGKTWAYIAPNSTQSNS